MAGAAVQHFAAQGGIALHGGVERVLRARVEGGQACACEEVVHLGLDRVHGAGGGQGLVALGNAAAQGLGARMPVAQCAQVRIEGLCLLARDAGHAVGAGSGAVGLANAFNQLGQCLVALGRGGADDAVAIEAHGRQGGQAIAHLGQAQRGAAGLAGQGQHALGLGMQQGALLAVALQAGQLQHVAAIGQHLGSRTRATAHWQAAISSGGRMRPSLSSSIRSSVSLSNSMPRVGQARATHSFWSSSPMCAMSCPVRMTTWSTPPARKTPKHVAAA